MAISLPSEDNKQFFTGSDCTPGSVNKDSQMKAMPSLLAVVSHDVIFESELTDRTVLLEQNIAPIDFPTFDEFTGDSARNLKGLNKLVKRMALSSVSLRNK